MKYLDVGYLLQLFLQDIHKLRVYFKGNDLFCSLCDHRGHGAQPRTNLDHGIIPVNL